MDRSLLIGTWDLHNYELLPPDGSTKPLWEKITGQLIYTEDGTVSVLVVRMGVAEPKNSEIIAYTGRYRLNEDVVVHDVVVSNLAHYIGQSLSRKAAMRDGRLILTTTELVKGAIHRVSWERAKASRQRMGQGINHLPEDASS